MEKWTEIKVELPSSWADEVSGYLIAMGSEGLVTGGGPIDTFELVETESARAEIKAFFPTDQVPEKTAEIRDYLQGLGLEFQISVSNIENDDWAHKWKEFFKPEKGRYLHPEQHRPITHREAARLQSFPDDFKFTGSKIEIAKQIGNAVPPMLAARIADCVFTLILSKGVSKCRTSSTRPKEAGSCRGYQEPIPALR